MSMKRKTKKTKKFKKPARPTKEKNIKPVNFLPTEKEEKKKRTCERDSENDDRKKRQKLEHSKVKKEQTDDWSPNEHEQKILEDGESDSFEFNASTSTQMKELELELLGLSAAPVNTRPYRVRPVDPDTARARSHAKRNRLVGKPKSKYLGVSWCNKKQQWHGRVWVSHLKKLEWVGYFEDEVECALEVNKRCIKLGLPIKNPDLEREYNSAQGSDNIAENTDQKDNLSLSSKENIAPEESKK